MNSRIATSALSILALTIAIIPTPSLAFAPPPDPSTQPAATVDEVHLVSGGFVRGEIVESMPGSHVSIIPRGSTEARTIAWAEISEVVRAGQSTAVTPTPTPTPEPEPTPEPQPTPAPDVPEDGAVIHINQTGDLEKMLLYRIDGEAVASSGGYTAHAIAYSEVCESPCDIVLPNHGGEFFVNGQKKYSGSTRFRLPGNDSRYDLDIKTRKRGVLIGGYVVMVSSVVAMGFMIAGPFLVDMPKRPNAVATWAGAGLVGAFGIGGGIAMMVLGRSKVTVRPSARR